jgi:uncharacterized protein (DUF849 family)
MFLKACLNGNRAPADHPALPLTPAQLAADVRRVVQAGADALHVHPRDAAGLESLAPEPEAAALIAIREACPGVPVGVSTGAWIEPDISRRVTLINSWALLPDFVSVNLGEPGALRVLEAVAGRRGVGLEAGIWSADDARYLLALTGINWLRLLFEPTEAEVDRAHATVDAIEAVLNGVLPDIPRLLHGTDETCWAMLERAARSGYGSRVGARGHPIPEGGQARPGQRRAPGRGQGTIRWSAALLS